MYLYARSLYYINTYNSRVLRGRFAFLFWFQRSDTRINIIYDKVGAPIYMSIDWMEYLSGQWPPAKYNIIHIMCDWQKPKGNILNKFMFYIKILRVYKYIATAEHSRSFSRSFFKVTRDNQTGARLRRVIAIIYIQYVKPRRTHQSSPLVLGVGTTVSRV